MDAAIQQLKLTSPPKFGRDMRILFGMDAEYVNLNNGSYGTPPLAVQRTCDAIRQELERSPDRFLRLTCQPLLVDVRTRLAKLIGAKTGECVVVPNASHGINTVLRNFEWTENDAIITFSTTYDAIASAVQYLSDMSPHPVVHPLLLEFPTTKEDILRRFKDHLRALPASTGRKFAVIDSIVSNPGVLLPWKEMVTMCKEEGVYSLVDAAHSIGQELDIDLTAAGPDFWVSNCHKWLYTTRSVAVLYVPERNQHIMKTSFPTSYMYVSSAKRGDKPNFVDQHDWTATVDFAPYLGVKAALDFRQWLGGEHAINGYCHDLAIRGGKRLAEILGTRVLDPGGEFTLNMVNVELPLPSGLRWTPALRSIFVESLLREHNMYAPTFYHAGRWWTRCSAQVWNEDVYEIEDFEKIGKVFLEMCAEVSRKFEKGHDITAKL